MALAIPNLPTPSERPLAHAPPSTLRVEDLLHTFLASSARNASPAMRVARALRQFFVATGVQVAIGRYHEAEVESCQVHSSARCLTLKGEPQPWDMHEAEALLVRMSQQRWPERPIQIAPVNWSIQLWEETRHISVGLAWADAGDGFVVWSRLDGLHDLIRAKEQANAFDRDLSHMRLFASAIRSVHLFERAEDEQQRMARLRGDLDELLLAADPGKQTDVRAVIRVLRDLAAAGGEEVRAALHEPIRRVASLAMNRVVQALEPVAANDIAELCVHLQALAAAMPCRCAEELRCVAICLRPAAAAEAPISTDAAQTIGAVQLLAHSASALALAANARTADEERACAERHLPELCRLIRSALPGLLCETWARGEQRSAHLLLRPIEAVRIWLRLWLVLEVASTHFPPNAATAVRTLSPELFAVFNALAAVLREGLREQLYSGTPGYRVQRQLVRDGLRVLVQHHAHWKCGVPRELDLSGHMEDVEANRQGLVEAEGHLEHVLEVYIAGYFLANLRIGPAGAAGELGQMHRAARHIVGQTELGPSPKASSDFQIAFALCALFHDSGMMLFPSLPPPNRALDEADDVAQALTCIRLTVSDAGRKLVETCARELELHECIDLAQEPELETWVERQRSAGEPNHALLSAWYLLKVCTRAACLRPEVIRSAVRATLLHGALGAAVDSAENGVAALLVLCDELCDWPPARSLTAHMGRDGRLLNERSNGLVRHNGRARTLGITGLWVEPDASGGLRVGLDPSAGVRAEAAEPGWPCITIGLRKPHELAGAVLELWLRSAQNIGRIRRSSAGWAPSITIEGEVPARLASVGQTTRSLLDATAQRTRSAVRGRLHQWLENSAVFPDCELAGSSREAVHLIGLQRTLASDDIALYLPELLETAFTVLEDRERNVRR